MLIFWPSVSLESTGKGGRLRLRVILKKPKTKKHAFGVASAPRVERFKPADPKASKL